MNIMQDNVIMGLSPRQSLFAGIGLVLGTIVYFVAYKKGYSSDISVLFTALVVIPFAALGFIKYHGLTFEKLVIAMIKQFFLMPKHLVSRVDNAKYLSDKNKIEVFENLEAKLND